MIRMRGFSDTLLAVYGAALAPEKWPSALSQVGAMFDAEGAVVIFYSRNEPADFISCPELVPAVEIYQSGGWWRHDLHAQRAIALDLDGGDVFNDSLVATPEEIETHPIYAEFFRQVGFGWLMSTVLLPELDMLVCLSIPRAREKGGFLPDEMEVLRNVGRHVEHALRVSLRLASLEVENTTLVAALDGLSEPVFALDGSGRLAFMNRAGAACRDNYFLAGGDRLLPQDVTDRLEFEERIAAAVRCAEDETPTPCIIAGRDCRRMALWALPASHASPGGGDHHAPDILVFGTCLDTHHAIDPAVLRDVFSLSLGEARLASLIGAGVEMREAAARLGVTQGTARIVLKRIFRKLGVNRQAQLVRQLSNLGSWGSTSTALGSPPPGSA